MILQHPPFASPARLPPLARPLQNLRHSGESRNPEGRCNGDTRAFGPDSQFQTRGSGSKPPLIPPWSSRGRVGRGPSVIKGEGSACPLSTKGEGFATVSLGDPVIRAPFVLRTFPRRGQPGLRSSISRARGDHCKTFVIPAKAGIQRGGARGIRGRLDLIPISRRADPGLNPL